MATNGSRPAARSSGLIYTRASPPLSQSQTEQHRRRSRAREKKNPRQQTINPSHPSPLHHAAPAVSPPLTVTPYVVAVERTLA
jgi:hypothetical protein